MNEDLAQVDIRTNDTYYPIYWEISMFGLEMNPSGAGVGKQFLNAVRRWFRFHGIYQPNRSYMRGAGPACDAAAKGNGGLDTGSTS
ncbi:MAG: hypothetical protein ACFE0S_06950 [Rhodospirillales bacterium]